jgi:YbbR domain-containing protein
VSNVILDRMLNRWYIKVLSLLLAMVLFYFYRSSSMSERVFSVPLEIHVDDSYVVAQDHINNVRIFLRGGEEIYTVLEEDISAVVDYRSHKQEGGFREPIQIFKSGSALSVSDLEIRVEPGDLVLYLEEKVELSLPVEPSLKGFPSMGYELTQFFTSPSSVTVIGPRSQMDGLKAIYTETINISQKYEDFTVSTRLVKPSPQVLFPGGNVVEFRGVIHEAELVKTLSNIPLALVDLPPGLKLQGELLKGSITLQGAQLTLEALEEGFISFTLDCSSISRPGSYTVPIRVNIPPDLSVLNYQPRNITLEIVRGE